MKKLTDEQIQAMLETELKHPADTLSALEEEQMKHYQSLFQQLSKEPDQGLPFDFASKVTGQLKIKLRRRGDIQFNLLALLGIVIGMLMVYGLLTVVDLAAGNQFLISMFKFKWPLIFGTVVLLGTFIFDQNIVEKKQGI